MIPVFVDNLVTISDLPIRQKHLGIDETKAVSGGKGTYACRRGSRTCGTVRVWWDKGSQDAKWACDNNFGSCCNGRCSTSRLSRHY